MKKQPKVRTITPPKGKDPFIFLYESMNKTDQSSEELYNIWITRPTSYKNYMAFLYKALREQGLL